MKIEKMELRWIDAALYGVCALLAMGLNLVSQAAVLWTGAGLLSALVVGTAVGFFSKYELDRRIVFVRVACKSPHNAGKLARYAGTAVLTTAVFWTAELVGLQLAGEMGRNAGAVCGLVVGYVAKFWLDARFVFGGR
jgi:putative flippase GtrA